MKLEYSLHGILFEWDSNKSETNLHKHGIAFENACEVFFDPFLRMMEPDRRDDSELEITLRNLHLDQG
jgi:uncharacterized DUF497 family protein